MAMSDAVGPVCVTCGTSAFVVPIQYGFPSDAMWASVNRGEIVLGGCTGEPGLDPEWACHKCGTRLFADPNNLANRRRTL